VPGLEGLLVATGHFRNGVLLSAITGAAVTALAFDQPPPVDLGPFLPERTLLRRHGIRQRRPG
jgi:glycine oxidase